MSKAKKDRLNESGRPWRIGRFLAESSLFLKNFLNELQTIHISWYYQDIPDEWGMGMNGDEWGSKFTHSSMGG